MEKLKVLVINESTSKSIISDTYTFVSLIGCLFANFYLLGDSVVIKIFICILCLCVILRRGNSKIKKMTPDEALKYLTDNKPVESGAQKPRVSP